MIGSIAPIAGTRIAEIGAGTGHHVAEVLKLGPSSIIAIDWDESAVDILSCRFLDKEIVTVRHMDGFRAEYTVQLTFAMFSLIQQSLNLEEMREWLEIAIRRLDQPGSAFVVEFLDIEVYKSQYKDGTKSIIYSMHDDFIALETRYDSGLQLNYSGVIDGSVTDYCVRILPFQLKYAEELAKGFGIQTRVLSLEPNNERRKLFAFVR